MKFLFTIFHLVIFSPILMAQKDTSLQHLKQRISDLLDEQKGKFAVAFKDVSSGKSLLINEKEVFHAASTMKTPVMIEVYRQAKAKKFSMKDSIPIENEFKSIVDGSKFSLDSADDSEFELYKHLGEKRTVHDLVYEMIIASSNLATNIVIEKVGAEHVTQTMRKFGAKDIQVLRGVEDQKAYDKGLNNTTTAYDLMLIFEKIAKGKAVDKKSSQAMINILLDQKFNTIIPAKLPKDVKVAHKTGFITALHHDSGIVLLPDGRKYVLVLLSKNLEDEKKAIEAMATASEMIYQYVISSNAKN
jgi:beta-lactamase class A